VQSKLVIGHWSLGRGIMLRLEELEIYKLAIELGEKIWEIVLNGYIKSIGIHRSPMTND